MFTFFTHPSALRTFFLVSLTILGAIITTRALQAYVKIPKWFNTRRARTYISAIRNLITAFIYSVAIYFIFVLLGINVTPLLASAGIVGIAIGLGARSIIEDLFNGIFLLSQDSIAIGDYIQIDSDEGHIESLGLRTLSIRDTCGALHIIPNGAIKKVINFSRHKANIIIDVPIKLDKPIDLQIKIIQKTLDQLLKDKNLIPYILPGSVVNGVEEIKPGGTALIRVSIVVQAGMRWKVAREFRYLLIKNFEKNKFMFG